MKTLVIAEHDNKILNAATYHAISAAKALNTEITLCIIGSECSVLAKEAALLTDITTVMLADNPVYQHHLAENEAALIVKLTEDFDYLVATATTYGKNLLPRVAALHDVAMISDVIEIINANTFLRPIYAGNALATVQSKDKLKILTVRGTAFPVVLAKRTMPVSILQIEIVIANTLTEYLSETLTKSSRPELTAARIIISGGRGLKSAENFHLLEAIADLLGAAIGASRAAVDAGFAPNDYQIGQTGKMVAPDLYIAVGISGAIQHLAGMKDSKVIVAINNDADAPIFQIADYALVGDLFEILPELEAELIKVKKK